MEMKDHVIIDGNAVYEIDDDCKNQIQATDIKKQDNDLMELLLILLLFLKM